MAFDQAEELANLVGFGLASNGLKVEPNRVCLVPERPVAAGRSFQAKTKFVNKTQKVTEADVGLFSATQALQQVPALHSWILNDR